MSAQVRLGFGLGIGTFTPGSPKLREALPVLSDFDGLWLRDAGSVDNLSALAVAPPVVLGSDLAFLWDHWCPPELALRPPPKKAKRPRVGVILRDWPTGSGEAIVFRSGDTGMAVRASCSVPAVFQPAKIGPSVFVDGGVVSPVAVDVARRFGADVVIAVDISGGLKKEVPDGIMNTLKKSVDIMYSRIAEYQIKNADVVIRPDMKDIGSTDMEKLNFAILEGEKAATLKIPELQAVMARLREDGRLAEQVSPAQ